MDNEMKACPCKNLRSHDMFFRGVEGDGHSYSSGSYWCLSTQNSMGPDGRIVDAEECILGRACFKG